MQYRPLVMMAACLLLAACSGSRQSEGPSPYSSNYRTPRDENFNGGPNALLLKYDANQDGSITRAELAAGLKGEFDGHDTKRAGCLDPEQSGAINAARIATDLSTASPLQDWNQDGCIDLKEFSTAANSLFAQLDRNGDGAVSALEFKPRGRPGQGPGEGESPGGDGERGPRGGSGGRPQNGGVTQPPAP